MKFQLPINIPTLPQPIRYTDKILLIGSCFTEHMAGRLASHKFQTLQNPHGILFNPLSVAKSLQSYASDKQYTEKELFHVNELWGTWDHHTRFSHINKLDALAGINASQQEASTFIKEADWIIITLGSAFQYFLTEAAPPATISEDGDSQHVTPFRTRLLHSTGIARPIFVIPEGGLKNLRFVDREIRRGGCKVAETKGINQNATALPFRGKGGVANNHRAPAAWFEKHLLEIPEIVEALDEALRVISQLSPNVKYLFTISPVRHVREGVVDNNRSKARLIEAVHKLCDTRADCHYFPAYELVMDVLRDYRFYDIDMVHPNYAATEAVWEAFVSSCIAAEAIPLMQQVKEIVTARSHRPRFPETEGHRRFMRAYAEKVVALSAAHPFLDLSEEAIYFKGGH